METAEKARTITPDQSLEGIREAVRDIKAYARVSRISGTVTYEDAAQMLRLAVQLAGKFEELDKYMSKDSAVLPKAWL